MLAFAEGFCVSSVFSRVTSPLFSVGFSLSSPVASVIPRVRCDLSVPMFPASSLVVEATPSSVEFGSLLVVTAELFSVVVISM